MLKSLFLSASGMLPRQRQLEIIANNLANINTTGYKKDGLFQRHLLSSMDITGIETGKPDETLQEGEVYTQFSQGNLEKTGNPLDVAIVGDGFFTIQTPEGVRLTRDGHFQINDEGVLVDSMGNAVLTDSGELVIPQGGGVAVAESGQIVVKGRAVASLLITDYPDKSSLEKEGNNYFKPTDESNSIILEPEHIRLKQGYLEKSNVNPLQEMTQMIELYRAFEMAQKTVREEDANLQKINAMGRIR